MTPTPRPRRRRPSRLGGTAAICLAVAASSACQGAGPAGATTSTAPAASPSRASSSPVSTGSSASSTSWASPSTSAATPTPPAPTRPAAGPASTSAQAAPPAPASCAQRVVARLTPAQRVGQLLMVGLQPTGSSAALARQVASQHLGGVIYLGGWQGAGTVAQAANRLQAATTSSAAATGRVRLLLAADQEGGQVQQLRGSGFTRIPSARAQARLGTVALQASAKKWAGELRAAGVNVNLAPVADTVPTSLGAGNAPIGAYQRDFVPGDPQANGRYAAAFVRGTLAAGVAPTVKHFPGLGRVRSNTDTSSTGITDPVTSATDPYLQPFRAGIAAGAPLVMVSSARYPAIDAQRQAMFSPAVVTSLLRQRLRFSGVVITDDVGAARAVAAVPVAERATRFIAAGGDIVLTAQPAQAGTMIAGITRQMAQSPAFRARVDAAVARVVALKVRQGLATCG